MERTGAGKLDQTVHLGDPVFDRLECADRLTEWTARIGIVARGFEQHFSAAGLLMRGDDRLQREDMERGIERLLSRRQQRDGCVLKHQIGGAAAVIEGREPLARHPVKVGHYQNRRTAGPHHKAMKSITLEPLGIVPLDGCPWPAQPTDRYHQV